MVPRALSCSIPLLWSTVANCHARASVQLYTLEHEQWHVTRVLSVQLYSYIFEKHLQECSCNLCVSVKHVLNSI